MTNAAKKMVCGIDEALLDEEAVDEALASPAVDIHPDKATKLAGKVELLVEHFRGVDEKDLADCDVCGAMSHADLPRCPFCGKGEEGPAAAEVGDPPDADDEGGNPGDDEDEGEQRESTPEPSPVVAEHPLVDKKAAKAARDAEKAAGKAAAKEAKQASKTAKKAPKQDATGAAATAVVVRGVPDSVVQASVEQLDRDVAEVQRLNRGMGAGVWLLAQKVAEISESQRWKLRLDDKGKVKFRTFEDFARDELKISRAYALDLQKIAVRFTRELFETIGYSKLRLVLQAPEDDQAEVLNALKEKGGAIPKRELQEDVAARRKKAGMKDSRGKPSKARKSAEKGKITVASILGKGSLKAYKKPEKKLDDGEKPVRAKRLGDMPWASLPLANDVTLWIWATTDGAGDVVFKYDIKRNED